MANGEFYWCLDHERVEGRDGDCPPDRRLGPYPTREAAQNWKATTEARNDAWDAEDREWEGED
jgi:hypothetical protein